MAVNSELEGSARLVLADGVAYLDPASAVFEAMLEGWAAQQRTRFLKEETVRGRVHLMRRFAAFTGLYPWQWDAAEAEAWFVALRSGERPIVFSTARIYQNTVHQFLEYLTDARYRWTGVCLERFGVAPTQVLHEHNMLAHVAAFEGGPARRPLTYDEVQALFDASDARVDSIRASGRKGALTALRDAVLLKTVYAFGLRRCEAWGLDLADLRRNPRAARFGSCGALLVRYGKSSRGGAPTRRTVLLVPEMDWVVAPLTRWVEQDRVLLRPGAHPGLWVTERCGRLSRRGIDAAFAAAREAAGLSQELDLHCLRHSYVTHLVEFGYPERFVQEQVGHRYASTTALYTGVSDEYRNRLLTRALAGHRELWQEASA